MADPDARPPGPAVVNEDERWGPDERCGSTIEHLGHTYGCVYGGGHAEGEWPRRCGAGVRDEYGHVSHDLMWDDGDETADVHPGEWWSDDVEQRVRAEGCRIARTVYA